MLFNSFDFLTFLLVVLLLKRVISEKSNNWFLMIAGIYFYAYWSWFYASLLIMTVLLDWFFGLIIGKAENRFHKKLYLILSLCISIGILAVFKYGNFIVTNVSSIIPIVQSESSFLKNIVLPVGISFYTFQSMAYVIDVYRGLHPVKSLLEYSTYVTFFPQLVAGPIERVSHLLPQLKNVVASKSKDWGIAIQLIVWGLIKKIVIADNLAPFVDRVFQSSNSHLSTGDALMGAVAFSIQIYGDFSGYTDIARGVAKFLGVDLTINFNSPYKSESVQDFWRRWHISLSSWIRDYVYIPLGGSRVQVHRNYINLLITMMIAGLWHGASWMFVLWGAYHGIFLVAEKFFMHHFNKSPWDFLALGLREAAVYLVICFGWVLFRCQNLTDFSHWLKAISNADFSTDSQTTLILVGGLAAFMWLGGEINNFFKKQVTYYSSMSAAWIAVMILVLCLFSSQTSRDFIYFQF